MHLYTVDLETRPLANCNLAKKISTDFVESTVNQLISKRFVKKQQMKWTRWGAHLFMQVRVKVVDEELGDIFKRWYPVMTPKKMVSEERLELAA